MDQKLLLAIAIAAVRLLLGVAICLTVLAFLRSALVLPPVAMVTACAVWLLLDEALTTRWR